MQQTINHSKARKRSTLHHDTHNTILNAAIEVFSQGTYYQGNIRKIAHRANVGLGSIYRHFESKQDLLAAIILQVTNDLIGKLNQCWGESDDTFTKIEQIIYCALEYFQNDTRTGSLLFLMGTPRTVMATPAYQKSAWTKILVDIFNKGQTKGDVRQDISAVMMMDTVYALLQRQFQMWVLRGKPQKLTDVANKTMEIIYSAFCKEAEKRRWSARKPPQKRRGRNQSQ